MDMSAVSLWQPHRKAAGVRSVQLPFLFFGFLVFAVMIWDVTSGTCCLRLECVQTVCQAASKRCSLTVYRVSSWSLDI